MNITKEQMLKWLDRHGWTAESIPIVDAIRALIESSGDKASVTPSLHCEAGDRIEHVIEARVEDPEKWHVFSRKVPPEIALSKEWGKLTPSPAPLPKEVEEAMETLTETLKYLEPDRPSRIALAVIKASLRPMVVTRKWIRKRADWAGCLGVTDVAGILRELGIEVEETP